MDDDKAWVAWGAVGVELDGGSSDTLLLRVGRPMADGDIFSCAYEIEFRSQHFPGQALGSDSLHALLMCLGVAASEANAIASRCGGVLDVEGWGPMMRHAFAGRTRER